MAKMYPYVVCGKQFLSSCFLLAATLHLPAISVGHFRGGPSIRGLELEVYDTLWLLQGVGIGSKLQSPRLVQSTLMLSVCFFLNFSRDLSDTITK